MTNTPTPQENTLLLQQVQAGETEAFPRLLSLYQPMLLSVVYRHFGNVDGIEKEELLQEARITFYRAACKYKIDTAKVTFGLYAQICVRNAMIDVFRRRKKDESIKKLDDILVTPGEGNDTEPLTSLIMTEDADKLYRKVVTLLSDYERTIFDFYIEERSTEEIAQRLGKSQKSVQNAIYRMIAKLRGALS